MKGRSLGEPRPLMRNGPVWHVHIVCDMTFSRSFVEAAEEREKDAQGNVFLTIEELIKRDQERRSGIYLLPDALQWPRRRCSRLLRFSNWPHIIPQRCLVVQCAVELRRQSRQCN